SWGGLLVHGPAAPSSPPVQRVAWQSWTSPQGVTLMKTAHLADLEVSRIGLGAMTMAGTYTSEGALDDTESIRTIHRALDLGVTHIDTAEIYGRVHSEELVGPALKGRRDKV